jgi:hypothetical protein
MSLTLRATLLVLFVSLGAQAQTRTLALYSGSAQGLSDESRIAMRAEVQRLLTPANLEVVWKNTVERKAGEDFELVAVVSFDGLCSAMQASQPAATLPTVSLADTSISDGRILPFFHVDCTRVNQILGSHVESSILGRALGRVIAHEIYHIIARTAEHHDTGIAKAVFSSRDLTNPRFEFDSWSIDRMRPRSVEFVSESSSDAGR